MPDPLPSPALDVIALQSAYTCASYREYEALSRGDKQAADKARAERWAAAAELARLKKP